jgi:cold-inducible RNA-binding protein
MATKIYIGRLPYAWTDQDLTDLFGKHGEVVSADVIMDRETGRSRGFGFVEMADEAQANTAIEALNGYTAGNMTLAVSIARPLADRPPRREG